MPRCSLRPLQLTDRDRKREGEEKVLTWREVRRRRNVPPLTF